MTDKPKTFNELFLFYHEYAKLLYSETQADNNLPIEMLFEFAAALDHISRRYIIDESEEYVVDKAYSHFKRACLDAFKLRLKKTNDQYNELRNIDTGVIDNGEFDKKLILLISKIRQLAKKARHQEGISQDNEDNVDGCFELWEPVYNMCLDLEKDFYENPNVLWAKKRQTMIGRKNFLRDYTIGLLSGVTLIILASIYTPTKEFFIHLYALIQSYLTGKN